jgi:O-antigen ligase
VSGFFTVLRIASHERNQAIGSVVFGAAAAVFALIHAPLIQLVIASFVPFVLILYWTLLRPHRWVTVFFAAAILLPPLPLSLGDSGPHPAALLAGVGVLAGILALPRWRAVREPLPLALMLFSALLLASSALAAIYSGMNVAIGSSARALLFAIGPYVFLYTLLVPSGPGDDIMRTARLLFRFATIAALFACVDFHFQLPAPAGYEPQFIWLGDLVLRRAQGLFYEASTLGNFCAFFFAMILAALAGWREIRIASRFELAFAAAVLAIALVCSYSRASLLNVLTAAVTMLCVLRVRMRELLLPALALLTSAAFIYLLVPEFAKSYLLRVQYSFLGLSDAPVLVLSGRISSWATLIDFVKQSPWHLMFGIGYKTLPYSDFAGRHVIADNTYLDLLIETGVVGLTLFAILNVLVIGAGLRAVRSLNPRSRFFGRWFICFWAGELVQMLSGDLITYWRVLPIYFWVLACAMRESSFELRVPFRKYWPGPPPAVSPCS